MSFTTDHIIKTQHDERLVGTDVYMSERRQRIAESQRHQDDSVWMLAVGLLTIALATIVSVLLTP